MSYTYGAPFRTICRHRGCLVDPHRASHEVSESVHYAVRYLSSGNQSWHVMGFGGLHFLYFIVLALTV